MINAFQSSTYPDKNGLEKSKRAYNKAIKELFRGKISGNFLIEVFYDILGDLSTKGDLFSFFNMGLDQQSFTKGDHDSVDYEICRYIIGAHRSNVIFLNEKELAEKQKDAEYKKKLTNDVLTNIRLRNYAGFYFRKKQLIRGDEFIFFNLPHDLYVLSIKANQSLNINGEYKGLYASIFNKALATLGLLEDNFVDEAYPTCRSIIELYLKLMVLKCNSSVLPEYHRFEGYDANRNICLQEWPNDFKKDFEHRKYKAGKKHEYMHFGWVDSINDYSQLVKNKYKYSISGLAEYVSNKHSEAGDYFEELSNFHQICNTYAHGNTIRCAYPLNDYFQICQMLGIIIPHTYDMLCEDAHIDKTIAGFDVLQKTNDDFQLLCSQANSKSTDKFNEYYRMFKM